MPLPDSQRKIVQVLLEAYCRTKVPLRLAHKLRVGFRTRGNRVTLFEERHPVMHPDQWVEIVVAQFRYDPAATRWTLYCADRNSRWHLYDEAEASENFGDLLDGVDHDPTGIFWG